MRVVKWKGLLPLFFFLVVTYIFKQFQGGFVSNFLFYAVLTLSLVEAMMIVGTNGKLTVTRRISKSQLTAGQSLYVEIEISFKGILPLFWISVEDVLPGPLQPYTRGNQLWRLVGFQKKVDLYYQIEDIPRGEHEFGEIKIYVGDFFGFFQKSYEEKIPHTVLVYPSYQNIRYFRSISDKNTGMTYSLNRSAEDVTSVMGIRNYVNGDRLSRIHWKATARTGQLKTKEFEYHVTNDYMFFIDCEARKYRNKAQLYERSISLAATLIKYALSHHFTVGLSAFREEEVFIPLARNQEHLVRMFKQLAKLQPDATYPLAKLLVKQMGYIPYGTTAMIITSSIDQELSQAIALLRIKKISVELFLVQNEQVADTNILQTLAREGVSTHLIDQDHYVECLKGVSLNGQVS